MGRQATAGACIQTCGNWRRSSPSILFSTFHAVDEMLRNETGHAHVKTVRAPKCATVA